MKITAIDIKPISQRDQSIMTIVTDVDYRGKLSVDSLPAVQVQMPTAVAEELKAAWEFKEYKNH